VLFEEDAAIIPVAPSKVMGVQYGYFLAGADAPRSGDDDVLPVKVPRGVGVAGMVQIARQRITPGSDCLRRSQPHVVFAVLEFLNLEGIRVKDELAEEGDLG
jgi:hypothetical protein